MSSETPLRSVVAGLSFQNPIVLASGTAGYGEELAVTEVATSVYVFRRDDLYRALPPQRADRDHSKNGLMHALKT